MCMYWCVWGSYKKLLRKEMSLICKASNILYFVSLREGCIYSPPPPWAGSDTRSIFNWTELLTDFNGLSNHLGLFSAERLRNHIHSTFIFTFFVTFRKGFFLYMVRSNMNNFQTGTTTNSKSELAWELWNNEGIVHTPQMQFLAVTDKKQKRRDGCWSYTSAGDTVNTFKASRVILK